MNATCLRDCFRWPWSLDAAWVALPIFVVTVRTLLQPITPEDYWWSLAMGELIDRGHWPRSNLFLYTIPSDQPFFNQAWLAQWIMTRIGRLAHAGNLILNTLLAVVAWGLIIRMALRRGARPPVIGVMATVGYFMGAGSMVVRSQMFAYVLFVCCALLLLELARDQVRWRVWAALIALTALWANLHGTFIYAPLLLLAAAAGTTIAAVSARRPEIARCFGIGMLAVFGACMLNPGGAETLLYPLHIGLATKGAVVVQEWKPPSLASPQGALFFVTLVVTAVHLAWIRPRPDAAALGLLAVTAGLAVTSWRAVLWWSFVWVLVMAPAYSRHFAIRARQGSMRTSVAVAIVLTGFLLTAALCLPHAPMFNALGTEYLYGERRQASEDRDLRVFSSDSPVALVKSVLARPDSARIFHHQSIAGLLEWSAVRRSDRSGTLPAPFVFVDQRVDLIDPALWQLYFQVSEAGDGWEEILDRYHVQILILHLKKQPRLTAAAAGSKSWRQIARQEDFVVFERQRLLDGPLDL